MIAGDRELTRLGRHFERVVGDPHKADVVIGFDPAGLLDHRALSGPEADEGPAGLRAEVLDELGAQRVVADDGNPVQERERGHEADRARRKETGGAEDQQAEHTEDHRDGDGVHGGGGDREGRRPLQMVAKARGFLVAR